MRSVANVSIRSGCSPGDDQPTSDRAYDKGGVGGPSFVPVLSDGQETKCYQQAEEIIRQGRVRSDVPMYTAIKEIQTAFAAQASFKVLDSPG